MTVLLLPGVRDALRSVPPGPKPGIRTALGLLQSSMYPDGVDLKRWETDTGILVHRIRIGSYRIVYEVIGPDVRALRIFHRREGYAWLDRYDP